MCSITHSQAPVLGIPTSASIGGSLADSVSHFTWKRHAMGTTSLHCFLSTEKMTCLQPPLAPDSERASTSQVHLDPPFTCSQPCKAQLHHPLSLSLPPYLDSNSHAGPPRKPISLLLSPPSTQGSEGLYLASTSSGFGFCSSQRTGL